jgi:branched-chain amino acid transport system substrate-binding protein
MMYRTSRKNGLLLSIVSIVVATMMLGAWSWPSNRTSSPNVVASNRSAPLGASCKLGPGVTAKTITLGVNMPLSGAIATLGEANLDIQKALVDMVNAQGGIDGRQLKLVVQNDQYDPQTAVTNAAYLINEAHVFALWGEVGSDTADAVLPIALKNHTPVLFPYDLDSDVTQPPIADVYSVAAPANVQGQVVSDYMATHLPFKGKKVGLLIQDNANGQDYESGLKKGADGANVVATQTYTNNETTFNAQILALHAKGADVIFAATGDTAYAALLTELQQLGLSTKVVTLGTVGVVTANVPKLAGAAANGTFGEVPNAFSPSQNLAGMRAIKKALQTYTPSVSPATAINNLSVTAWIGGLLMEQAMKNAGQCLNAQTLNAGFEKIKNMGVGGLAGAVSFSPTNHLGVRAVAIVELKSGAWTQVSPYSS